MNRNPRKRRTRFLSTLPARGATRDSRQSFSWWFISIHAPREGSDSGTTRPGTRTWYFYPRSPRGERHGRAHGGAQHQRISIHAPREGSDIEKNQQLIAEIISIHAPREGSDGSNTGNQLTDAQFLSTLPARGATSNLLFYGSIIPHFYPRSPRGERRFSSFMARLSIFDFYPRSPRGERLDAQTHFCYLLLISIHAPREGSDLYAPDLSRAQKISIHAPREGSDRPLFSIPVSCSLISIHAPREGSDVKLLLDGHRERVISIHAPREGSDLSTLTRLSSSRISIHAPREGSDFII